MVGLGKTAAWGIGIVTFLILLLAVALPLADDPLKRYLVERVNEKLSGYTLSLGDLDLNPFDLGVTLENLVLVQEAHPDPPVLQVEEVAFSLHWRELLSLKLVGELEIERPRGHVNLEQLQEETKDEEPFQTRGWREALTRVYPLEINRVAVHSGELTYIDENPDNSLVVSHIEARADNIRNIRDPDAPYPSSFEVEGLIFGQGYTRWSGEADFLQAPHLALRGDYRLENVPLGYLKPIMARRDIDLRAGTLSSTGRLEFSPQTRLLAADRLELKGLRLDYLQPGPDRPKKEEGESEGPPFQVRIGELQATGEAGYVNRGAEPVYRLFIDQVDLQVENFTTEPQRKKTATARLRGRFMGSGSSAADGSFRPGTEKGPDFTLDLRIVDTRLKSMNNMLRAYSGLDVAEGSFSLFAEATVRDGRIDGYVKPFFANVDVFEMKQDKKEGLLGMAWEAIADTLAELLENEPRELATRVDLSGPVEDPEASTLQIVLNLVRNAFFNAIIPALEGNVGGQ